jgi:polyisoprenoid-binding protein YceI
MTAKTSFAAAPVALLSALTLGLIFLVAPSGAPAQTSGASPVAHASLAGALQLDRAQRTEVETALRAMPPDTLYLTFARIHAAFRTQIGQDDLSIARALIDYALLAEAELRARGLPHPERTETAGEMLLLYELVL